MTEIKRDSEFTGHLSAFLTILIWGTTFISTKFLLEGFTPIEILFLRFVMGAAALFIVKPKLFKVENKGELKYFFVAGISGVTLYFLFENIALTLTEASNIGIIVSVSPFFTAILSQFFLPGEKLKAQFFIGFIFAMAGIIIITLFGVKEIKINPVGDILGVLAAFVWSIYSIAMKKIGGMGYNMIQVTRRVFSIGLVFMVPFLFIMDFSPSLENLKNPFYIGNFMYLGFGASAVCFVTWNWSVKVLGAIRTSIYVYLIPVITLVSSIIMLGESLTVYKIIGTVLIMVGLVISENKLTERIKRNLIEKRS